jgi:hypothetical protein
LPFSPFGKGQPPPFVDDFHPKNINYFKLGGIYFHFGTFTCLSSNNFSSMVYDLLRNCFVLEDFLNGFDFFSEVCGHIDRGHVPSSVLYLLVASQLLALEKQTHDIQPILIRNVTYWLADHALTIQFNETFVKHFNLH